MTNKEVQPLLEGLSKLIALLNLYEIQSSNSASLCLKDFNEDAERLLGDFVSATSTIYTTFSFLGPFLKDQNIEIVFLEESQEYALLYKGRRVLFRN